MIRVYFCPILLWDKQSRADVVPRGVEDLDSFHITMLASSNIAFALRSNMAASTPAFTVTFQQEAEKRKEYSGHS